MVVRLHLLGHWEVVCYTCIRPIRGYKLITYDLRFHYFLFELLHYTGEINIIQDRRKNVKISLKTTDAFKHSSSIVVVVVLPRREWRECMVSMIVGYFWNSYFSYFLLIFLLIPNIIIRARRTMSSYYFYDAIGLGNV